jgi:hypothetical protein
MSASFGSEHRGSAIRATRLARNQSVFRDINDRLGELHDARSHTLACDDFLCECASDLCVDHITLTLAEYRQLRANPVTFAVFPNDLHVFPDVERVADKNPGYWIVEKLGVAAEVARTEAGQNGGEPNRGTPAED